jgi:hypothetical protein
MRVFHYIVLALTAIFLGVVIMETFGKGFTLAEMDWDGNGRTSPMELFATMDFDFRYETINGRRCKEVYSTKDGSTVKTIC